MPAARTASSLLIAAVLALGAAGCGGGEVSYEEVPGPPADIAVPNDTGSLGAADDGADADATPTPTPDAGTTVPPEQSGAVAPDTAASTDTGGTTAGGTTDTGATTDSGGSTAPAEPDGPANDTAPPEGSEAQQFEDFCAENPGAC